MPRRGLDMAIWDALAKAAGLPVAQLLGSSVGKLRAYNTNGLWLLPLEKLAGEARELVTEGNFSAIKVRLGRPKIADDLKALKLVRGAIGDEIQLMCDFNQGQTLQEAIWRCHALDDQGLYWFEEPVVFDNYAQSAQLARELKTSVQIGENIYGLRSFFDAVQAQAADLYMPDLMRIGGVTGWMRAAAIAGGLIKPPNHGARNDRRIVTAGPLIKSATAGWQLAHNPRPMQMQAVEVNQIVVDLAADLQSASITESDRSGRLRAQHMSGLRQ